MSDRWSAAADIAQTQQLGHQHWENKNTSLVLKRKRRLCSKREGSIFFSCMRHILFLQRIRIQDALSDFFSLATVLSQFKPLVVYVAEILFPREPPDHEKSLCVTLLRSQHLWQAAALYTHRNTKRTWSQTWHWVKCLRKLIIYIDKVGLSNVKSNFHLLYGKYGTLLLIG